MLNNENHQYKYYYLRDNSGNICQYTDGYDEQFPHAIGTDEEIVRTHDGSLKLASEVNADVEELHNEVCRLIAKIDELQKKLSETDWYVLRLTDVGKPIPENVIVERASARYSISIYRNEIDNILALLRE